MKYIFLILSIFSCNLLIAAEEEKIRLILQKQARPYIYSVSFIDEDGADRWYQLQWSVFEDGRSVTKTCDVYYDSIGQNFYCSREGQISFFEINRPYEIFIVDKD